MNRLIIIAVLFSLFLLFNQSYSDTIIPDKSNVSGFWSLAGSPYIIEGEAIVAEDSVLTIGPGVEIRFKTGTEDDYISPTFDLGFMRINGKLSAEGTASLPIIFTRDGSAGRWGIILFDATTDSANILKFCRIRYGSQVLHPSGWMEYSGAVSLNAAHLRLENCFIQNNIFDGILCDNTNPEIVNNLISDNGRNGITCINNTNPQIINCTIAGNTEYGLDSGFNSTLSVINSVFWGNTNSLSENLSSNPSVSFSLIQESSLPAGVENLGHNIFAINPQFVDPASGNYTLHSNSFCINSANPDTTDLALPDFDLAGKPRIIHDRPDMGAFEFGGDFLRVTSPNGLESWKIGNTRQIQWYSNALNIKIEYSSDNGDNWSEVTALTENDGAYDWLIPPDSSEQNLIRISDAATDTLTDLSDSTFIISDKTIISDGLAVYGNWTKEYSPFIIRGEAIVPADSTLTIEPGVEVRFTAGTNHNYKSSAFDLGMLKVDGRLIAEGAETDSIIFTRDGLSGNWGMIFFNQSLAEGSSIKYSRIEYASYCDSLVDSLSLMGSVSVYSADLTVSNSQIGNNLKSGLHSMGNAGPQILHNEIWHNGEHGILFSKEENKPQPLVKGNHINGNSSDGIFINGIVYAAVEENRIEYNGCHGLNNYSGYAQTQVVNNMISHNQTGINGQSLIEIVGNLIAHNSQGIICDHIAPQIMNNTIVHNSADGIYCEEASPYVTNCIFSGNTNDFDFLSGDASAPTASYSLFKKSFINPKVINSGGNRLNKNPAFAGGADHPYALSGNSAAIDHGTADNPLVNLPDKDLAGKPRIYDGDNNGSQVIDMGAYEFSDLVADFTADDTIGTTPLEVQFTDQSFGEIETRLWQFGDGDSSEAENPGHVYAGTGEYTVSLLISGPLGSSQKVRINYILVKNAPVVSNKVADTSFAEDSGEHFIAILDLVFSDADSADTLSYSDQCTNPGITVSINGDSLLLTTATDFFGSGSVIVTATDRYGLTANDTFQVTITAVNDPPLIDPAFPDSMQFKADSSASLMVWDYVSDIESHDSSLVYQFLASNDSINYDYENSTGLLTVFAHADFRDGAKLFMTVSDDSGAAAHDSVEIFVESPTGLKKGQKVKLKSFHLNQNYPNPFNPITVISYQVGGAIHESSVYVELSIYNILGQKIQTLVSEQQPAGNYTASFNGSNLSSGIYIYQLTAGKFAARRKMILLR